MKRTLIALGFFVCTSAFGALKDTAYGIFSLTKINDSDLATDNSWTNSNITGVVVRTWWKHVQPTSAQSFDWSYFDKGVSLAKQYNKKIAITIVAGTRSPDWIYSAGANKFNISGAGAMPCPWDPVFQSYWQQFVLALGARYDGEAVVAYITMGGLGRTEECDLCKNQKDVNELKADGGVQVWIQAGETIAGYYSAAFPTTPFVYADGQPIPGDTSDYGTIVDYCVNTYGSFFGIKSDGLRANYAKNSYGGQEIPLLSPDHPVGFQDVRTFDDPTKLQGALNVGIDLGAHYIEVYTKDVNAANDQTILADAQKQLTGQ